MEQKELKQKQSDIGWGRYKWPRRNVTPPSSDSEHMVQLPKHPTEPWITFTQSSLLTELVAEGLGSNPGEDMDVCKCIVPLRHGGTLNYRRAASPLMWLVEGEERWEAPGHPQGFLPLNWGGTEQNHTATCVVLKAKANDRRKISSP
ncbi:uncharacterized protein TNCV_1458671 [Trichonephila clavipes]|nr:uncharacterized protein TNCV_1458671 [Trichonephila clavipes]